MNQQVTTAICNRIRSMWEQGLDTVDMARTLKMPEHEIEAQLHIVLDLRRSRRRSVLACLGRTV